MRYSTQSVLACVLRTQHSSAADVTMSQSWHSDARINRDITTARYGSSEGR
jgi:hypothetical protein